MVVQLDQLRYAIEWQTATWETLASQLRDLDLRPPADSSPESATHLLGHLRMVRARTRERYLTAAVEDLVGWLEEGAAAEGSPLWSDHLESFRTRAWSRWDAALAEVSRLSSLDA